MFHKAVPAVANCKIHRTARDLCITRTASRTRPRFQLSIKNGDAMNAYLRGSVMGIGWSRMMFQEVRSPHPLHQVSS